MPREVCEVCIHPYIFDLYNMLLNTTDGPDTGSVYEPDGQSQRQFPETADLRTTYRRRRSSI
jgi:hypothetical protein